MTTASTIANLKKYCESLTAYKRRPAIAVKVGNVGVGGDNPIRIQSMTTVDTMDTKGSVEQSIRMIESGCEIVRITAPSLKEAQNLENIKNELRQRGYDTPLVADIHFTPNAAEVAAGIVEKVRVNPGNYADKKKFQTIEYTDETYQAEIDRIREKFLPLVKLCKANGTAMRIGTNHGSLSDRIMSRYGDTPLGMVESALEFIRICEAESYYDIIISMKASNPKVMVEAYRLLVNKLDEEGLKPYPLHIGVTEAGEGDDGRIKSAVGIGTLLEDGLGDTIRVSLTEDPEFESPVGKKLADRYLDRAGHTAIPSIDDNPINPFDYQQRKTREVFNIGGDNVPRVIADYSNVDKVEYADLAKVSVNYDATTDKFNTTDSACDFIYTGPKSIGFMLPNGVREIQEYAAWVRDKDLNNFPLYQFNEYINNFERHPELNFLSVKAEAVDDEVYTVLKNDLTVVLVLDTDNKHAMPAQRRVFFELAKRGIDVPVIILRKYPLSDDEEELQLFSATDMGGLLIDGFGDGVFLTTQLYTELDRSALLKRIELHNKTCFGILQATRTRISKTEYISCPSCGRTLFDLQETTAMIRKRTDHLKGVKIGIMGCIVNGPGEMADADYGYVGVGKGKIALYREKNVVKKAVPAEHAVDELIELIREDGRWIEPNEVKN